MEVEVHHGVRLEQHQATRLRREDLSLARIHPVLGIQVKRYEWHGLQLGKQLYEESLLSISATLCSRYDKG